MNKIEEANTRIKELEEANAELLKRNDEIAKANAELSEGNSTDEKLVKKIQELEEENKLLKSRLKNPRGGKAFPRGMGG